MDGGDAYFFREVRERRGGGTAENNKGCCVNIATDSFVHSLLLPLEKIPAIQLRKKKLTLFFFCGFIVLSARRASAPSILSQWSFEMLRGGVGLGWVRETRVRERADQNTKGRKQ